MYANIDYVIKESEKPWAERFIPWKTKTKQPETHSLIIEVPADFSEMAHDHFLNFICNTIDNFKSEFPFIEYVSDVYFTD